MKITGLWMREHLSQDHKVAVSHYLTPYYFYENNPNNYLDIKEYGSYKELVYAMRQNNAKYLVAYSWDSLKYPMFDIIFENRSLNDFELIKSINYKEHYAVLIYEIKLFNQS